MLIILILILGFIFWYQYSQHQSKLNEVSSQATLSTNLDKIFHPLKYSPKRMMTRHEEYFFKQLESLVNNQYYIFPQVHLNKVMQVDDTVQTRTFEWRSLYGKIDRRSIDFIIFTKKDLKPIVAIELDDWTHNFGSRFVRDRFVDNCMRTIGLPILHISKSTINHDDQNKILNALHRR